ncbi:MAG: 5-(carboxyamino)imidazole ribonucleotide mutase [Spirochaetaceae bacterium]|jgi:5-(carboxyamino)imidazole ribonucleotide mutase|nr:5-(carboxyamino)imidazole ribonucleotide mutase [Spirochaetaceae bacterium]
MKAAIIFGSRSDTGIMEQAAGVLREFGVEYTAHIVSAHRTPELLEETLRTLEADGTEVIIAGAGLAAHLPGVIAGRTLIPVIGVPVCSGGLGGMDALLSIVQMPKPIPVAAVGIDNGANAAYLACRILALKYDALKERLAGFRDRMKADFIRDNPAPGTLPDTAL